MRRSRQPDSCPAQEPDAARRDSLFQGALRFWQHPTGYRVSIDTVLLAAFAAAGEGATVSRVVDLGSGVGGVTLILHHLTRIGRADLVESELPLVELARRNLSESAIEGAVHHADLAVGLPRELSGTARAVLCNPPFFPVAASRPRKDPTARRARSGDVAPFLRAASLALGRRGRAYFVYPSSALSEFFDAARAAQLVPKRMRLVHPRSTAAARVALVELSRAKPGGLVVEPALIEWAAPGVRAPELAALLGSP